MTSSARPATPHTLLVRTGLMMLAAALVGCSVAPKYERPATPLPDAFGEPENADRSATIPPDWWTLYRDARLNELVAAGLAANADVRLAVARIEETDAALREVGAALYPQVDVRGNAARSRVSTIAAVPIPSTVPVYRTEYLLTATTSFEIDVWGRLRSATDAARALALGTRYARDVVGLTLSAAIAQTYFAVRSLDAQIDVARGTLALRDDSIEIVRVRARAGLVSDLDVNQAEGARADAAAQLKELQRQRAVAVHQLGLLTGRNGLALDTADVRKIPLAPVPPAGLPSTLLERRPDVRQAEQAMIAANAQIGVARAAEFPAFSLTGQLGGQSASLGDILTAPARLWNIGAGLLYPIIDAGRFRARTEQAEARQRQTVASYQRATETAFREVADALANYHWTAASESDLRERVDRARNTLRIADVRYKSGYSGYLDVLDAQRTLNDAELALLRNRQALLAYSVDLMKSLGGGWQPPP